jgi:large subunit ribosomal protein L21
MYAVVEIQGSQFKVSKNQKLYVNRLKGKEGTKVSFDNVLLVDEDGKVKVGMPKVSGAVVEAKIVSHQKDDKVIVFKKKRRKGYKVKNGHRQLLTELLIEKISQKKSVPVKSTEEKPKASAKPKAAAKSKKASDK